MNCQQCQTPNPDKARFCLNCGTPLEAERPVLGERKFVTVLFADVVGSTAIGEQLDPEQVAEIMNGAFARLNSAVNRYGGTVARLMGDAILALFGAPIAYEDHAERAVRAGLEILETARQYARGVQDSYGVGFSVRVGVTSGLAVLAFVGDEIKTEYTAMGDTANVAARLQSAAEPGMLLVSADTHHLVGALFESRPRGALELKGKSTPVRTYEILGPKAVPGKVRGLAGLSSPMVGRDADLDLLLDRLNALGERAGALAAIVGEAGVGKSRLTEELRAHAAAAGTGAVWLEGRCLSYGQTIGYLPWRQLLREAIGASEADTPAATRERLARVATERGLPPEDVPFLELLLAVETPESRRKVGELEGEALVQRIVDVTRTFVRACAAVGPTVLVFDDLHWADAASVELLRRVADLVETDPVLVLCVLRPDRDAPGWDLLGWAGTRLGERYSEVRLQPLDVTQSRELLANLLHVEGLPESVRLLILRKSEGNPFFLEEVLRSLIDAGHIVQDDGHWRAARDVAAVTIPDTLSGVLSARIDRLPEATKQVAQTAAVLGRVFAERLLSGVCAAAPPAERIDDVQPHVGTLLYGDLVREEAHDPELEYIFKHALTQEAAYDLLLLRRRRELHRRSAEVLERLYEERSEEMAPVIAHHAWLGEDWSRAAEYSMQAGAQARAMYALRESLDHYQRARAALDKLPEPPAETVVDATLAWGWAAYKLGLHDQMLEPLQRAEGVARSVGDKARLAQTLAWVGATYILTGFPSHSMPALIESQQLADEVGDEQLILLPLFMTTFGLVDRDPRDGLRQVEEVLEMARRYNNPEVEAHTLALKGMAHARLGEFEEAERAIQAALAMEPVLRSGAKRADVNIGAGLAYFDMGQVARGLEYARRGAAIARGSNALECACVGYASTGLGSLRVPDFAAAREALEESSRLSESLGDDGWRVKLRGSLALAQVGTGQAGALEGVERALGDARALGDVYSVAILAHALGDAYARQDRLDQSEALLDEAMASYRQKGMRPYIVRGLNSLAELYERQGRTAEAAAARQEAGVLAAAIGLGQAGAPVAAGA